MIDVHEARTCIIEIVQLRHRLAQCGMWATSHAMQAPQDKAGYELAAELERRPQCTVCGSTSWRECRLHKAAPDLLAAPQTCLNDFEQALWEMREGYEAGLVVTLKHGIETTRAAIAKATSA